MITLSFRPEEIKDLETGLGYAAKYRGFALAEGGMPVTVASGDYLGVSIEDGCCHIVYEHRSDFFRAVALLVGKLEQGENSFLIREKSSLKMCGIMLDCSRNAVLKSDRVIQMFTLIAMMGMNSVMLYTEDTYELPGYPYFGYMRGRYSAQEMKRFNQAALDLGLDMIPCIQTLGHLKATLFWNYAKSMKDTDEILLIDEPKTYEFIEAMFKSMRSYCSSRYVHIGMDEAHEVGLGNYLKKHGYVDRFELLSRHLNRVCEIAAKYDFKPMMWSDMFFRLGSSTGDYYDLNAKIPEDAPEKIPSDISMVYWDYYHKDKETYDTLLTEHKALKRPVIFAGGVWSWNGLGPNYEQTFASSFPALASCREHNISRIFATLWADDGAEINVFTNLLGIQLFAEYNYHKDVDMTHLKEYHKLCTGLDADAQLALALDNLPGNLLQGEVMPVSRAVLYQDILCGLLDKNMACFDMEAIYDTMQKRLAQLPHQGEWEFLYDYYRALLVVLKRKCHMGVKIRAAYDAGDRETLAALTEELLILKEEYETFRLKACDCWHTTNKPFGFERLDMRFGGAVARIDTASRKLRSYLAGETDRIEELDEELLWFRGEDTAGKLVSMQRYINLFTVSMGF